MYWRNRSIKFRLRYWCCFTSSSQCYLGAMSTLSNKLLRNFCTLIPSLFQNSLYNSIKDIVFTFGIEHTNGVYARHGYTATKPTFWNNFLISKISTFIFSFRRREDEEANLKAILNTYTEAPKAKT